MKRNWVKGLDRTAILIAIPIAIVCGIYKSKEYTDNNRLWSFRPERITWNYMMTPNVQDYPLEVVRNYFDLSDREIIEWLNIKIEMFNIKNNTHFPRLDEGFNKGFHLRKLKVISPSLLESFYYWSFMGNRSWYNFCACSFSVNKGISKNFPLATEWIRCRRIRKKQKEINKENGAGNNS